MPTVPRYEQSAYPAARRLRGLGMPESSSLLSVHPVAGSPIADSLSGLGRQVGRAADVHAGVLAQKGKGNPLPDQKEDGQARKDKKDQPPQGKEEPPKEEGEMAIASADPLETYASVLLRHQEKQQSLDTSARANQARKEAEKKKEEIFQGYRASEARGVTRRAAEWFDGYVGRLVEELPGDDTRLALVGLTRPVRNSFLADVSSHEARELSRYRTSVLSDSYLTTESSLAGMAHASDAQMAEDLITIYLGQVQSAFGGSFPKEQEAEQEKLLTLSYLRSQASANPQAAETNKARFAKHLSREDEGELDAAIAEGKRTQALQQGLVRAVAEHADEESALDWVGSADCDVAAEDKPGLMEMTRAHFRTQERQREAALRNEAERTHLDLAGGLSDGSLSVFSLADRNLDEEHSRAWYQAMAGENPDTDPEVLGKVLSSIYSDRKAKPDAVIRHFRNGVSPALAGPLLGEYFAVRNPEKTEEQKSDLHWTAQAVEMFDEAEAGGWRRLAPAQVRRAEARWFMGKKRLAGKDIYDSALKALLVAV